MYGKTASIYYSLASFLLLTGLFVLTPNTSPEVTTLQSEIKHEISVAWEQTIGDEPFLTDLVTVLEGVEAFYTQSADAMIALLEDRTGSDRDLAWIFNQTYNSIAASFKPKATELAVNQVGGTQIEAEEELDMPNFMAEAPILNIVPEGFKLETSSPVVAGVSNSTPETFVYPDTTPVNLTQPWVTIKDNTTGQLYCLAVYNGEVNKYLGECKYEYY